jgi:hypothetical protein
MGPERQQQRRLPERKNMAMKLATIAKLGIAPVALGALVLGSTVASAQMRPAPDSTTSTPSSPKISKSAMKGTAYQIPAAQVADAKSALGSSSVVDKDGNSVGSVHDVKTNPDGTAAAIRIDVGGFLGVGSRLVELSPAQLKYERDRNVLITNLTKDEIKALPEIKA